MACDHSNAVMDRTSDDLVSSLRPVMATDVRMLAAPAPRITAMKEVNTVASPLDHAIPKNTRMQRWLRIVPEQKPKTYAQIYDTADMSSLNYWLGIIFSAGIAALGLVLNSPAVIIGTMLISPLMGPIMAAGLALAAGDLYLAAKAVVNLAASISLAIAFSAFIVWLLPFHSVTG